MKTLLILLVLCCQGDSASVLSLKGEERRDALRGISDCCGFMKASEHTLHCCVQRAYVKHGLQDEVCWECQVREVLELPERKHEKGAREMPNKYRKRAYVIEAIQLTWENWEEVCDFVPRPYFDRGVYTDANGKVLLDSVEPPRDDDGDCAHIGLYVNTIHGRMLAEENDWIVKSAMGDFYPYAPEDFEATYEELKGGRE